MHASRTKIEEPVCFTPHPMISEKVNINSDSSKGYDYKSPPPLLHPPHLPGLEGTKSRRSRYRTFRVIFSISVKAKGQISGVKFWSHVAGQGTPGLLRLRVTEPTSACRRLPQLSKLVRLIDQSLYEGGYLISNGEEGEE